ncbi:hypothetical protein NIES37_56570 [Tolypothrix tenuis PCC 7101]|uniref:Uncharacterized protein n=1 Tax=Tolypothrix tenuis PCC 7101 TaxID=231146 RepID=A0A1Z4N7E1_9CYAN|nr:hypothetical protein [Aulosira sp. FACHB-113]BAZ01653.1 hypothetical protein NIES37_56570 [Tolypothrix tenuis PCC 7101]BAZ74422.1 hypothetical protein NIES50_29960 [Aulosira laxa NIES-50]
MSATPHWIYGIFPALFLILFMVGMILTFRHDWSRLAELYRTYEEAPPNFWRMQSGAVGLIYYKSTLNVGVSRQGLYLSIFPLFSFGLPPLLIPWNAVRKIEVANQLFEKRLRLYLSSPEIKLILREDVLESAKEYLAAQGFEWV